MWIVDSGIKIIVRHVPPPDEASVRWMESVMVGDELLRKGGVKIMEILGPIEGAAPILRNGEVFDPGGEW